MGAAFIRFGSRRYWKADDCNDRLKQFKHKKALDENPNSKQLTCIIEIKRQRKCNPEAHSDRLALHLAAALRETHYRSLL